MHQEEDAVGKEQPQRRSGRLRVLQASPPLRSTHGRKEEEDDDDSEDDEVRGGARMQAWPL